MGNSGLTLADGSCVAVMEFHLLGPVPVEYDHFVVSGEFGAVHQLQLVGREAV